MNLVNLVNLKNLKTQWNDKLKFYMLAFFYDKIGFILNINSFFIDKIFDNNKRIVLLTFKFKNK